MPSIYSENFWQGKMGRILCRKKSLKNAVFKEEYLFFLRRLIILVLPKKKRQKQARDYRPRAAKKTPGLKGDKMSNKQENQKSISLKTATRIRVIVIGWMKEVEACEEAAIQIADNVASNCFLWLANIRVDSEKANTAKSLFKELLEDNLSRSQVQEIREHITEAIASIRELYAGEQKARAEREKARQGREEKRKQAEEEKARNTAETKARKARAKAAADAIRDFKPEQYQTISFLDATIGDYITFHSTEGYSDTYQIMDVSKKTLYVVNGYDSQGRAQYIAVDMAQFEYRDDGTVTFTDAYDSANIANVKCYRQAV